MKIERLAEWGTQRVRERRYGEIGDWQKAMESAVLMKNVKGVVALWQ